jgi:hypothetical protein
MDTHTTTDLKLATRKQIIGQKITDCFLVEESDGYFSEPLVIIQLENGIQIHAQRDDEFNDVGIMAVTGIPKKETVYLNYEGVKKKKKK